MALSDLDPTSHPGKENIAMVLSKKTPSKSNNISEKRRFQMQLHRKHQKRANTWPNVQDAAMRSKLHISSPTV